jgi:hypothetical protein
VKKNVQRLGFDIGDLLEILRDAPDQFAFDFFASSRVHVNVHHRHDHLLIDDSIQQYETAG